MKNRLSHLAVVPIILAGMAFATYASAAVRGSGDRDSVSMTTDMPVGEEVVLYLASDADGMEEIAPGDLDCTGLENLRAVGYGGGFYATVTQPDISVAVKTDRHIVHLELTYGRYTRIDLSHCPELQTLECQENRLASLDLSHTPGLRSLNCNRNLLTALDLSPVRELRTADCGDNQIETLDLSESAALEELYAINNRLASLDFSKCPKLYRFSCSKNRLEQLVIAPGSKIAAAHCYSNRLPAQVLHEFIERLAPTEKPGVLTVINTLDEEEGNVCRKDDVAAAVRKGFKVFDKHNQEDGLGIEYAGSDPEAIQTVCAPIASLYPNPAGEYVLVETAPCTRVQLLDARGVLLAETKTDRAGRARFDLSEYARGGYLIEAAGQACKLLVE